MLLRNFINYKITETWRVDLSRWPSSEQSWYSVLLDLGTYDGQPSYQGSSRVHSCPRPWLVDLSYGYQRISWSVFLTQRPFGDCLSVCLSVCLFISNQSINHHIRLLATVLKSENYWADLLQVVYSVYSVILLTRTSCSSLLCISTGPFSVIWPDPTQSADYKQHTNPIRPDRLMTPKVEFSKCIFNILGVVN